MSAQPASTVPSAHCTRTDDHLAGRFGCKTEVKDHPETFKAMLKAKGGGRSVTGRTVTGRTVAGGTVTGGSVRSSFRGPFAELFSNVAVEAAQQMRDARIMAELTRLQAENESLKKQLKLSEKVVTGLERTQGMPAPGYPAQGYAAQGYAAQGYAASGYAAPGYAAPSYPAQIPGKGFTMQTFPGQPAGGVSMEQQAAALAQMFSMACGGGGMGGGSMGGGMGGGGGGSGP